MTCDLLHDSDVCSASEPHLHYLPIHSSDAHSTPHAPPASASAFTDWQDRPAWQLVPSHNLYVTYLRFCTSRRCTYHRADEQLQGSSIIFLLPDRLLSKMCVYRRSVAVATLQLLGYERNRYSNMRPAFQNPQEPVHLYLALYADGVRGTNLTLDGH